jgi:predicted SAM-dependent methyltransferase
MRLNLGCCDRLEPGYTNVDVWPGPGVDQVADLTQPWPWGTSTVREVLAYDVFEHLADKRHTINELYRVLQPGGRAKIEVPSAAKGAGAFQDPTHVSYWTANDFEYYEKGNYARERFRNSPYYGVHADFVIEDLRQESYQARWDEVWKIHVVLRAVK